MVESKRYFSTKELAEYLSISKATLIAYRADGIGPAYLKIGRLNDISNK